MIGGISENCYKKSQRICREKILLINEEWQRISEAQSKPKILNVYLKKYFLWICMMSFSFFLDFPILNNTYIVKSFISKQKRICGFFSRYLEDSFCF